MKTVLVTGSSGLIGSGMVNEWLRHNSFDNVICLVRDKRRERQNRLVQFVKGDIAKSNLGLSSLSYKELTRIVCTVFHSAADTSFTITKQVAEEVNLNGTKNVVQFAKDCQHLDKFGFVSTAYVAGKREGLIWEDELVHRSGFVNYYEASKYNAELYIQSQKNSLPFNIYRLSTVIGEANGKVRQFNAIHKALQLCYYGLAPFIPANPNSSVDFISSSFVTQALVCLFNKKFVPNSTYHIVAGEKYSMTISELLDVTFRAFEKNDLDWKRKTIERPAFADEKTFSDFVKSVQSLHNPILSDVIQSMNTFAPQLLYPKIFDTSLVDKILLQHNIRCEPIKTYFEKIVQYCLLSKWGKVQNHE